MVCRWFCCFAFSVEYNCSFLHLYESDSLGFFLPFAIFPLSCLWIRFLRSKQGIHGWLVGWLVVLLLLLQEFCCCCSSTFFVAFFHFFCFLLFSRHCFLPLVNQCFVAGVSRYIVFDCGIVNLPRAFFPQSVFRKKYSVV